VEKGLPFRIREKWATIGDENRPWHIHLNMDEVVPKGMRLLQLYNNMNEMVQPSVMKIEKRNNDYYPFF
jgi:hypothetical protein